ncbi:MAG: tetratricopeptide repeat protein [Myxococcota bacterium]
MATTRARGTTDTATEEEFLHHLYKGGELLAAGKVIEAKDHLEKAFKLHPKNEKGQNLLGLTYFKLGLFDRASEIYETLVRENPADPTLRVNLGLVYLKTNALQRAVREFETAVDLAPEHKKAHNYLGLALAQAGELGRAREHFIEAGSEAMAEKMARAIAGENLPKPMSKPSPAQQQGFAEIEGREVVEEQGGQQISEEVASPPSEESFQVMSEDETPPPPESPDVLVRTEPPPGARALAPPLGAEWGAQFGLDGEGQAQTEVPAPPADVIRFVDDEGPSAPPSEPLPPQAEAEVSPVEMPVIEATPQEVEEAPETEKEETPQERGADIIQLPAAARPSPDVPVLMELSPKVQLGPGPGVFGLGDELLTLTIEGELYARLGGLVALGGRVKVEGAKKRFRGKATDRSFGEGLEQLQRLEGSGVAYVAAQGRHFTVVDLDDESAYFCELAVFAFEEPVMFENGRVTAEGLAELDLVHLRGKGKVLVRLEGALKSLAVAMDRPAVVPLEKLVGWHGPLTPRLVALGWDEGGAAARTGVELTGEGWALFAVPGR